MVSAICSRNAESIADRLCWRARGSVLGPKGGRPLATGDKDLRNDASKTDKRKQSLYFPESMLQEIKEEAARLDRSLSWVVQRAWKISRIEIKKLPSVNEVDGGDDEDEP